MLALLAQATNEFRNMIDMWNLLVGAGMPFLVAFVAQQGWSKTVNAIIGLVLSGIAGAVTTFLTHGFHADEHLVEGVMATIIASKVLLEAFWLPTGWYQGLKNSTSAVKTAERQ